MYRSVTKGKWQILVPLILIVITTSCVKPNDPQYPIYYKVQNNTNSSIKIIYNGLVMPGSYSNSAIQVADSIIVIESGNEKSLFVNLYSRYAKVNPETGDTLESMRTLRIYINDTILSNKNYLLTKYWEYVEPNNYKAELKLSVYTDDFNLFHNNCK